MSTFNSNSNPNPNPFGKKFYELRQKTILLVDDCEDSRLYTRRILEEQYVHCLEASDILQAWELLQTQLPHLVLLDLNLFQEDGRTLLLLREQHPILRLIPVVTFSAEQDIEAIVECKKLGASDYILRPISPSKLFYRLKKVLKDHHCLQLNYSSQEIPAAEISVPAQVVSISEIACKINSAVKMKKKASFCLQGPLFEQLQHSPLPVMAINDGIGSNEHNFAQRGLILGTFGHFLDKIKTLPEFWGIGEVDQEEKP